jgi:hypothetical protein
MQENKMPEEKRTFEIDAFLAFNPGLSLRPRGAKSQRSWSVEELSEFESLLRQKRYTRETILRLIARLKEK